MTADLNFVKPFLNKQHLSADMKQALHVSGYGVPASQRQMNRLNAAEVKPEYFMKLVRVAYCDTRPEKMKRLYFPAR